ncbi:MAG: SUMF1/EgtB/PvdO family nonheme iron enzyme [Deltaproteobacteria bacterium]|nr:SUMF1/EgtB/PvdO family nonheme iron enzyme [Deltaproteobacteria bacterium]
MSPRYLLPLLFLGCVELADPPSPTAARPIAYGAKVYLADNAAAYECRFAGPAAEEATKSPELRLDSVNCFIRTLPGTLWMEEHEVTNGQFQLCLDSGACKEPNPSDANKSNTCENEDDFDNCPVLGVPQFEAQRYCEWVGRRLPSGIEHTIARQRFVDGNVVTTPKVPSQIAAFPRGNEPPSSDCNSGVLQGCGKPKPIKDQRTTDEGLIQKPRGAASDDVTPDGLYDLTGNVSEWAADLIPPFRRELEEFPWFCAEPVPAGATECPEGRACVYGRKANGAIANDSAPVCIASDNLVVRSGTLTTFVGGNYDTSTREPSSSGTFSHATSGAPEDGPTNIHGFRCAGRGGAAARDFVVAQ